MSSPFRLGVTQSLTHCPVFGNRRRPSPAIPQLFQKAKHIGYASAIFF
jgi:hypothetical protein